MRKNLILTGSEYRTKKQLDLYLEDFDKKEIVYISLKSKRINVRAIFKGCSKNTKIIVFTDIPSDYPTSNLVSFAAGSVRVDLKYKTPFSISPHIVMLCDGDYVYDEKVLGATFNRRFHHIDCDVATH